MPEVPIHYLAVLACVVSNMIIGSLWFGPLFGKQWAKLSGFEPSPEKMKGMWKLYVLAAIGAFIMAYVLAHSIVFASTYLNISGVNAGLQGGLWNWLGFVAPVTLGSVLWEGKSWKLWVLTNAYYLVSLEVMGLILVLWK